MKTASGQFPALPSRDAFPQDFFLGPGEMSRLMRDHDWRTSPLGDPATWPTSLKTVIRIMLTSRYAMWMGWGPELTFFCNDAYRPTLGVKGDWALGAPTSKVWAEIWPDIGPLIESVMGTGVASWSEDLLLFLERSGVPEETYHTFSYSPLTDDEGRAAGMFCVVTEDTKRVISERRLATLRELASGLASTNREDEALKAVGQCIGANRRDMPFTLTYLYEENGRTLRLASATGIEAGHDAAPPVVADAAGSVWPLWASAPGEPWHKVSGLGTRFPGLPMGDWNIPPQEAVIVPLKTQGQEEPAGFFVSAVNPYRPLDPDYAAFLELVASQIAAALANARAYEEARKRAEALAQIDRAKTAFFSNVSHEFRTPLTLMLGPLEESLADRALPRYEQQRLQLMHRNGTRLLKLVNSLLDFSRIEAGRVQASFVPTDLARFTAELASNFRSATEKAGIVLDVDCPPLDEAVYIDRDMWEKVVLNLLSNAFKFTFEGRIAIAVRAAGGFARMTVSDTGIGIPASELPRMFERFHRIEGARGRSFEGSGIGLALVQELVSLHGGTIGVDSEEGKGTTFKVTIPCGKAHLPKDKVHDTGAADAFRLLATSSYVSEALSWLPGETSASPGVKDALSSEAMEAELDGPSAQQGERARILLADDNADMREYVRHLLGGRHHCETAPDGLAALEAARRHRPDLIVTDIMMPRLDGIGLIRELRSDPVLREIPIIALSARAREEASIEGRAMGADDYIAKPFSAKELLARVDGALAIARIRREAGEALRESEARFRHMADNAPVMIWTTDAEGHCTFLSRSWYQFTGQTPEIGLGFGWVDAVHPDDRAQSEAIFLAANERHERFALEYRLRRCDGEYCWAIDAAAPWFGEDGEFLGYIGSVIDITARKALEETQRELNETLSRRVAEAMAQHRQAETQLRHAQKMEAVGRLTGGVAHDFNNLLQVIGGNLQLLGRDVAGNQRAELCLGNALAGVARGARLAAQLLAFGRKQPLAPKVVNLATLIRSTDDMLRRALGETVEIETVIAGGLWNTFVDAGQVENALLNLAINARDAMQGEGRLTIEASNAALDDEYAAIHAEVAPGQYVMLAVSDTGCGMPSNVLDRVFEPFFTTKPEGQGTGLGLSMVYGFVTQSGGHVKLDSEPGRGTTVRIYLPRSHEPEDTVTIADTGPVTGGSETVLVVEDDEDVRVTVVEMLSDLGYRVLKARDADSALVIVESGMPIDLLFTDVVMPGKLRSPELARKARERIPNIAVLFTSGYSENSIVHGGRLDDGIELLSKPYTREAMARKIRHVLRNQQQRRVSVALRPATPVSRHNPMTVSQEELGTQRILLVEDDEEIRVSTGALLEMMGHEVVAAADAREALAWLETNQADVLMTDVNLKGMTGPQLVDEVRTRLASLPVIFVSGQEPGSVALRERSLYLRKPYEIEHLNRALIQILKDAA